MMHNNLALRKRKLRYAGYARAQLRRVTASPLAAVGRTGRKAGVALAADLLVAVVF